MQFFYDNFQACNENNQMELSISSIIGNRENQQDSVGESVLENRGMVVVCDGMGGHAGGKQASSLAVDMFLHSFHDFRGNFTSKALDVLDNIDLAVMNLKDRDGNLMKAGTTLVAAYIDNKELHWVSVGDSRIYIIRGKEMVQVTEEHNYKLHLNHLLKDGKISEEEYKEKIIDGDVLISFLGMGGVELVDVNSKPFILYQNDIVLLTTDGLCKVLEDEIIHCIISHYKSVKEATKELMQQVRQMGIDQVLDNTTFAIIKIK